MVSGCRGKINDVTAVFPFPTAIREYFPSIELWREKLRIGDYVFVTYDATQGIIKSLWGYDAWIFIDGKLLSQCRRLDV